MFKLSLVQISYLFNATYTSRPPILNLTMDCMVYTLNCMDLAQLMAFSGTSKSFRKIVTAFINRLVHRTIRPFFDNPTLFLNLLRHTRSVLSGSLALFLLFPCNLHSTWKCGDADILVPREHKSAVITFLKAAFGYEVIHMFASDLTHNPDSRIQEVVRMLCKDKDKQVDVIISDSDSSILPIWRFHSTIVMNFISADGIYCAFPSHTLHHHGIVNPIHIQSGLPSSQIEYCIQKYKSRGFNISTHPNDVDGEKRHSCGRSSICPNTIRSSLDSMSLAIAFDSSNISTTANKVHPDGHVVTWILGGDACTMNMAKMTSYLDIAFT
jgi:hypothetical protein